MVWCAIYVRITIDKNIFSYRNWYKRQTKWKDNRCNFLFPRHTKASFSPRNYRRFRNVYVVVVNDLLDRRFAYANENELLVFSSLSFPFFLFFFSSISWSIKRVHSFQNVHFLFFNLIMCAKELLFVFENVLNLFQSSFLKQIVQKKKNEFLRPSDIFRYYDDMLSLNHRVYKR